MKKVPARRPNKTMTGKQLMNKAIFGTHTPPTEKERKEKEANDIIYGHQENKTLSKKR